MHLRSILKRWVMFAVLLQTALPSAVSLADALLERAGSTAIAHVESGSTTACVPVHSADCALCRDVQRAAVKDGAPPALAFVTLQAAQPSATRIAHRASSGEWRPSLSRAPPRTLIA